MTPRATRAVLFDLDDTLYEYPPCNEAGLTAAHARLARDVEVDFEAAQVRRDGAVVDLSAREFELLAYLIEHRGTLVTRQELLRRVWGHRTPPRTRTVDVHVTWLRRKLEPERSKPRYLLTVHGLGYRFVG